jgi:ssDNA-binding replication factor A large subunit
VQLFADLVATGLAWQLQGRYGREAKAMIDEGIITVQGDVNWDYYQENFAL